jgi:hypothetical protein
MKTFNTYTQTQASIKILEALNTIRESLMNYTFAIDNSIEYNQTSGVCYLMVDDLDVCICADEFGNDVFIETHNEAELTLDEWLGLQ